MSQLHKQAKIIFIEEISNRLPKGFIDEKIKKYSELEKIASDNANKNVAKILVRRFTDMKVTLKKSLNK